MALDVICANLELAQLYAAYAGDIENGTHDAPTFADAVRMHELIEKTLRSAKEGPHISLPR